MTLHVTRPSQAVDIQSALDAGEPVVVECEVEIEGDLYLHDDSELEIRRKAALVLAGGWLIKDPAVERIHRPKLLGGGWLKGGLDLTGVTDFRGDDVKIDVTGDPYFDDLPAVVGGLLGYYNRIYGLHVSARRKAIALMGGANAFEVRGGDIHLFDADAEAIVCDATEENLNRVVLECSVEGVSGTALRVKGGVSTQAHVREAVSCEWQSGPSYRVRADGKHIVVNMDAFGNAPDAYEGDNAWFRRGTNYGAGLGVTYNLHPWSKLT